MAEAPSYADNCRQDAVLDLTDDFLKIEREEAEAKGRQVAQDEMLARQLMAQQQYGPMYYTWQTDPNIRGILEIIIDRAELVKNYGLTRMDPYCRVTVNNQVLETPTCANGSTSPIWNRKFRLPLPKHENNFLVEIFDERQFGSDSRIAYAYIDITEKMLSYENPAAYSFMLSGYQGEEKEGTIHLQICLIKAPKDNVTDLALTQNGQEPRSPVSNQGDQNPASEHTDGGQGQTQGPGQNGNQPPDEEPVFVIDDKDVQSLCEMFPTVEVEVVKSVIEASRGDMNLSINSLLAISVPDAPDAVAAATPAPPAPPAAEAPAEA